MHDRLILAIDQGTSGTKAIIFDTAGRIIARATSPLDCTFPRPGLVEQDPEGIYRNVIDAVRACVDRFRSAGGQVDRIACCGISNQRETFCIWDQNGRPLCNAVVWQCKRSVGICNRLRQPAIEQQVRQRTGLIIDPYFSATKIVWLLENDEHVRQAIEYKRAMFGTVDTWLLYRLTGGSRYLTDYTNASRTLLFNIDQLGWDQGLIDLFGLKGLVLPDVRPSACMFGESDIGSVLPQPIPITAMIGDSHAAAFGECCLGPGMAKATLGTGCSILLNTGHKRMNSRSGMVSTICWSTADRVDYALEGIIVSCGSTIQWLRDQLGLFQDSQQTESMACSVEDCGGVYLIPAFSGLGAPHWQMDLKGAVTGLTFGTNKAHIIRAALESIAYQIKDVIYAMEQDSGIQLQGLRADGGITNNRFVMQYIADLLGKEVVNMGIQDVSALGAALLAGLQMGLYKDLDQIAGLCVAKTTYKPGPERQRRSAMERYEGWLAQVRGLIGQAKECRR